MTSAPFGAVRRRRVGGLAIVAIVAWVVLIAGGGAGPAAGASAAELRVSPHPDRTADMALDGAAVSGVIHVFVAPGVGLTRVRFWLDDPDRDGRARKVERNAPFDFAGTADDGLAIPFDTTSISDGSHVITAVADDEGGTSTVLHARVVVANEGSQLVASPPSVSFVTPIGGPEQRQEVHLTTTDGSSVDVSISSDSDWLRVEPTAATTPAALAVVLDPSALPAGTHTGVLTATGAPGRVVVRVEVLVTSDVPADQIHLGWTQDPSTSLSVTWRTPSDDVDPMARYRPVGDSTWTVATGAAEPSPTLGRQHRVEIQGLQPGTEYEYEVSTGGGSWSSALTARTAGDPSSALDVVFVADTGIVGREDGLASGTAQVIEELAALDAAAVLAGGDYAYFNTETRYQTLDHAIDAWLNQMQPIGAHAPIYPVWGNHEALLGEDVAAWAARFPDPGGMGDRRNYSVDMGPAHFVAIHAVAETTGLSDAQLSWIEQDIEDAQAAGARWIIPYMHVPSFSEGKNHPSNLALRAQLGPLFERLGIDLVLTAHDQSYERTYPLVGVPDAIAATSSSRECYSSGADGTTWLKVGPGGKLSNKNGSFSQWRTAEPPSYTAARNNTLHHVARIHADPDQLAVEILGIDGRGSAPMVVDAFHYQRSPCPASTWFEPREQLVAAVAGGAVVDAPFRVGTAPESDDVTVSVDVPWATVSPASLTAPGGVVVVVDPGALAPGTYSATLTATSSNSGTATATVRVVVEAQGTAQLRVSSSPDRSASRALDGVALSGDVYIFSMPEVGIARVRFWLDDPSMSGKPRKVERNPPYDFAGTADDGRALPYSTAGLTPGEHTVTAAMDLSDGRIIVVHGSFTSP